MSFDVFERATMSRASELRAALADYPLRPDRDGTPEDWLYGLYCELPTGLVALHRAYADFLDAEIAGHGCDDLDFRDWSWLLAHRLFVENPEQLPERHA